MKDIKDIIIAVLVIVVIGGGAFALTSSDEGQGTEVPVITVEDGTDGKDGARGIRGVAGPAGPKGEQGPIGPAGTDAEGMTFDLNELTDAVLDEIEDREDRIDYGFSGEDGDYTYGFTVEDEDTYEITIRHFGSGDFDASIEDEDDVVSTLVDSQGHLSYTDTRILDEGDYIVRISADGDWEVEIEQK